VSDIFVHNVTLIVKKLVVTCRKI